MTERDEFIKSKYELTGRKMTDIDLMREQKYPNEEVSVTGDIIPPCENYVANNIATKSLLKSTLRLLKIKI